jgi:hydrogenase maturation protease
MRDALSASEYRAPVAPVCIVGAGSPFGDDRAGWLVAEILAPVAVRHADHVQVLALDRPGPAVLEAIVGRRLAIVVDAVAGGSETGRIHKLNLADLEDSAAGAHSTHGFGLAEALRLGAVLGRLPQRLLVYGIEVGRGFGYGKASRQVTEAAAILASDILDVLVAEIGGIGSIDATRRELGSAGR